MPLYNFNVHDGSGAAESDPAEFPDYRAARGEAVKLAGQLLIDVDGKFWNGGDWRIDVTDPAGLVLCSLYITGIEAAAVAGVR